MASIRTVRLGTTTTPNQFPNFRSWSWLVFLTTEATPYNVEMKHSDWKFQVTWQFQLIRAPTLLHHIKARLNWNYFFGSSLKKKINLRIGEDQFEFGKSFIFCTYLRRYGHVDAGYSSHGDAHGGFSENVFTVVQQPQGPLVT